MTGSLADQPSIQEAYCYTRKGHKTLTNIFSPQGDISRADAY